MPEATAKSAMTVPAGPQQVPAEKPNNNNEEEEEEEEEEEVRAPAPSPATHVSIPLVNEQQLTAATGGAELSCYRCTVPFGVVVLIAGVVVTAVAYSFNSHGSTISYFGLVLLSAGLLLLASSALCWRVRLGRRKERRRESQTTLVAPRRSIFGERQPPGQQR
ncbi:unnamed protein product [Lota lota]